jgi:hypothetical protein
VRAGETWTALLLMLNLFFLLTGYYIIKPVREPLILTGGGAEVKTYASPARRCSCSSSCRRTDFLRAR